jgi:hypothetical protein
MVHFFKICIQRGNACECLKSTRDGILRKVGKQTRNWSLEKRFSASGCLSVGGESGDAEEEQSKLHCLHFYEVHLGQQGVWMRTDRMHLRRSARARAPPEDFNAVESQAEEIQRF